MKLELLKGVVYLKLYFPKSAIPQDDFYKGNTVTLLGGVEDSVRTILDYNGFTRVATISEGLNDWSTPPTLGTQYKITRGSISIEAFTPERMGILEI